MTERENFFRNVKFQSPKWIPSYFYISDAAWDALRGDLEDVVLKHPLLFPDFQKGFRDYENYNFGPFYTKGQKYVDAWQTTWETTLNGIEGCAIDFPIKDWNLFDHYKVPDANVTADRDIRNWELDRGIYKKIKDEGKLSAPGLPHGFLFLRLEYLRGFENFMCDLMDEEPLLNNLIDKIVEHNMVIIKNYIDMGVDCIVFGEDLGTQISTIVSPELLRKYIFPSYKKMFALCKQNNIVVFFHSDGKILDIIDDLIETGIDIINPQDICNGIDNLEKNVKGKVCIRLDIDRQKALPYGTPKEIEELIEESVKKLGSPQGGLELVAGIYPPIPPENVDALFSAIEKYRTYWWE